MLQVRGAVSGALIAALISALASPKLFADEPETFWAFQTLSSPQAPTVHGQHRTAVDAFVLAKLEEKQLELAPEADRRTILRRAHLDLIGLPPTPTETEAFLADASADAYERLIDRLLASPHFGERWGRHWLDVAGYVLDRKERWKYRDYVINSFNADKPYDRFLMEQIAGDELVDWRVQDTLTPEARELLTATGLLRSASDNTGNVMTDIPSYRYGILFDTLEILGTGVLGLTLQCARCHTHKYDPIPQTDFYRLIALFTPAYNPEKWLRNGDRVLPEEIDGLYDIGPPPKTHLMRRGDITRPGREVQAGFLRALSASPEEALAPAVNPEARGETSGRRLSFAQWLTRPNTPVAGLVARVAVNRIWHHLFGRGVVSTPGNLGRSGAPPTHPELLDYLGSELVRGDWRLKPTIKLVMMSSVYRQASVLPPRSSGSHDPFLIDPENTLLWRMPLRRVDSEVIRDSILAVSGKLDRTMGGKAIPLKNLPDGGTVIETKDLPTPTSHWRRSIYLAAQRAGGTPQPNVTLLSVFNHPISNTNCTKRRNSAVVLQSLTMLNDGFVLDQAGFFAERLINEVELDSEKRIERAFQLVLARPPTVYEAEWSRQFVDEQRQAYRNAKADAANRKALAALCHVLFNLNNFLYAE